MHRAVVPRLPKPVVRAWLGRKVSGFRDVLRAYDSHVSESGTLNFDYCDVIADFYAFVWRSTEDIESQRIIAARLLDLGYSHDRFHVRDVVAELLGGLRTPPRSRSSKRRSTRAQARRPGAPRPRSGESSASRSPTPCVARRPRLAAADRRGDAEVCPDGPLPPTSPVVRARFQPRV